MSTTKITGSGTYIPEIILANQSFLDHHFYDAEGVAIPSSNDEIIEKFQAITGIEERRYASKDLSSADLATQAAETAIEDAKIDRETLDYIIVAHNVGNIKEASCQVDILPSVAARVKTNLGIKNPRCVAYDLIFGCPGWIEGMIQAHAFIKAGMAKKCLVIGSETLSRVVDASDRDSMIFADGAGATIVEARDEQGGILSHLSTTFTAEGEADYIYYGTANQKTSDQTKYIKMQGRKVYEFALSNVPQAMKDCLELSGVTIDKVKKIFIHQANQKMDEAIVKRFYRLFKTSAPEDVLPMNIEKYGNSSVATVPTLYDLVVKTNFKGHTLASGDVIIFASVGAGMNINAITYQV